MICLDTNAVIAIVNGRSDSARAHFAAAIAQGEEVAVSSIVLFELTYGAERSARSVENLSRIETFLASPITVLAFDAVDADEAGKLRVSLESIGRPIGPYDLLIAAQARRRGAAIVTANRREFDRVPGLRAIDWSK